MILLITLVLLQAEKQQKIRGTLRDVGPPQGLMMQCNMRRVIMEQGTEASTTKLPHTVQRRATRG